MNQISTSKDEDMSLEIWDDITSNLGAFLWVVDGLKYGFVGKRSGKTRKSHFLGYWLSSFWFKPMIGLILTYVPWGAL